jgi:hypothetical protein
MATKQSGPTNVRKRAAQIREAWSNIEADATYGDLTLAEFDAAIASLEEGHATLHNIEDQLTKARNERDVRRQTLWDMTKRVRSAAKGKHGDDSDEYERFGGTRMSERKRPSRSTATE